MKRFLLLLHAVLLSGFLFGQLQVDNEATAQQLVQEILLGPGIETQNVSINGESGSTVSSQLGYFNAENAGMGMQNGLILATGKVKVAEGPNDLPTAFEALENGSALTTEPDLELFMAPAELNDVAVLEFDFVATGDTLDFNYIFASEEYNEHTCSAYNDAFGLFISGPGINGGKGYENDAINLARVPGRNVPVAINTVNQGMAGEFGSTGICNSTSTGWQANSQYFVNNEANASLNTTQFDGFTVPLNAKIKVICGQTYHIKIAIADAVDDKNDSAVFIEAGSFSIDAALEARLQLSNAENDSIAVEGCSAAILHLNRLDSTSVQTVYLHTGANQNVFSELPDSVTFYPEQGHMALEINIEDNQEFEGLRQAAINVALPVGCNNDTLQLSLPLKVKDYPEFDVAYTDSILLNCTGNATIEIDVEGGKPPYNLDWDQPNAEGFSYTVSPEDTATYTAYLSDDCGIHSRDISVFVERETFGPLQLSTPEQQNYNCLQPVSVNPLVQGGSGDYNFSWKQNNIEIADTPAFNQILDSNSPLHLTVSDPCVADVAQSIELPLIDNPIFLSLGKDTVGSCDEEMRIVPEASGGFGQLSYLWSANGAGESGLSIYEFEPMATTIVSLTVQDQCDQAENDTLLVRVNKPPIQFNLPGDTSICKDERLVLNPRASGGFGSYEYSWNGQLDDNGILSVVPVQDRDYEFGIRDECQTVREHTVSVTIAEVAADFEFNEDSRYSFIENYSTVDCAYEWTFPDGSVSSAFEPDVTATEISGGLSYLQVVNQLGCTADARQRFEPEPKIFIPTAFTPDGDGLNEVFKAEGEYVATFEMVIFDQWGSEVYRITGMDQGWNGEVAHSGSYAGENSIYNYIYTATTLSGEPIQGKGTVTVVR